jgi:hypothetical protein
MTKQEIDTFEKVQNQLEELHSEISALSKKSQNDALNLFKFKFVNNILEEANKILGNDYKPFVDFELFNVIEIPSNSDAAMMLSQYLSCFEKLRADNVCIKPGANYGHWFWIIDGKTSDIRTLAPKKLSK